MSLRPVGRQDICDVESGNSMTNICKHDSRHKNAVDATRCVKQEEFVTVTLKERAAISSECSTIVISEGKGSCSSCITLHVKSAVSLPL